jgi:hypothetical protein
MFRPIKTPQVSPQPIKSFNIDSFRGVDYRSGEYAVSSNRAPYALNTMCGENPGTLRPRTKTTNVLSSRISDGASYAKVYGIHVYEPFAEILVHMKNTLYLVAKTGSTYASDFLNGDCTLVPKKTGLTATQSRSFMFEDKLYIIGCGKYLVYDGVSVEEVANNSHTFIPTTVISRLPSGGGTPFEAVNLVNKWRKNSFRAHRTPVLTTDIFDGNGTDKTFTLTALTPEVFTADPWTVKVDGNIIPNVIEDRALGTITFETAPAVGSGNVVVEYYIDVGQEADKEYKLDTEGLDADMVRVVANGVEYTEESTVGQSIFFNGETGKTTFYVGASMLPDVVIVGWEAIISGYPVTTFVYDEDNKNIVFDTAPSNGANIQLIYYVPVFSVDRPNGIVTFLNGIDPDIEGVDNVVITFAKTITGYADQINKCSIYGIFGGGNDSRVFLSGNSESPNKDWQSGLYDPTYFPDTGYTFVGSSAIVGYVKQYNTQMIVKASSQQDATAYLRTFSLDGNSNAVFPVEQGVAGNGAISKDSFAYLDGKPLFVSARGVDTIYGTNVDNHRNIANVSELINNKLLLSDLSKCVCASMGTNYYVFTDTGVFVCDSRMQYKDDMGKAQYEWMYWEGSVWSNTEIPSSYANIKETTAVCVYRLNGIDYLLGGVGGMIYRFKTTKESNAFTGASWETPRLVLGSISKKKRIREIVILFNTTYARTVTLWYYTNTTTMLGAITKPNGTSVLTVKLMRERVEDIKVGISATSDSILDIAAIQIVYQHMND